MRARNSGAPHSAAAAKHAAAVAVALAYRRGASSSSRHQRCLDKHGASRVRWHRTVSERTEKAKTVAVAARRRRKRISAQQNSAYGNAAAHK
jgi:hypothetical protein